MGMTMQIVWPLGEVAPKLCDAEKEYNRIAPQEEGKDLLYWVDEKLQSSPYYEIAQKLELQPFLSFHHYPTFLEYGYSEDKPDEWFTPSHMREAAQKVLDLVASEHPDALLLRDGFADFALRYESDADEQKRAAIRPEMYKWFDVCLRGIVNACEKCQRNGIEKVALCAFD